MRALAVAQCVHTDGGVRTSVANLSNFLSRCSRASMNAMTSSENDLAPSPSVTDVPGLFCHLSTRLHNSEISTTTNPGKTNAFTACTTRSTEARMRGQLVVVNTSTAMRRVAKFF